MATARGSPTGECLPHRKSRYGVGADGRA
jgi:hypothetical protein